MKKTELRAIAQFDISYTICHAQSSLKNNTTFLYFTFTFKHPTFMRLGFFIDFLASIND